MNNNYLTGFPYRLVAGAFLLFLMSFYVPISPKPVFYAGLMLPGVCWLLWRPAALPAYFKAFGLLLLPLAMIQLLNIQDASELKLWLYIAVFLACCLIVERSEWGSERIYRLFAWFSLFALGYATVEWLWIWYDTDKWIRYDHLFSRRMDPNNTSILITSGLVFIWLTVAEPRLQSRSRWSLLAGMILLSCTVLLSAAIFQSRSTLVGFGLFMGVYIFMRRWWGLGLLALAGVVLVAYLVGADQVLSQRGMSYRPQIWDDAWHRVVDTCGIVLGCGEDGYRFLGKFTHTHNLPLGILYTDGLLGMTLIGLFAFVYIRGGIQLKSPWFLLSMIGFGALMTNTGWLLAPPKAFWAYFWVPVLLAFIQMKREHVDNYLAARG
jgi:O-antigen ligase